MKIFAVLILFLFYVPAFFAPAGFAEDEAPLPKKKRQKKLDLKPDFTAKKSPINDEMLKDTKFKEPEKGAPIKFSITCTDTSGRILNQNDPGYDTCISNTKAKYPENRTNAGPSATIPLGGK